MELHPVATSQGSVNPPFVKSVTTHTHYGSLRAARKSDDGLDILSGSVASLTRVLQACANKLMLVLLLVTLLMLVQRVAKQASARSPQLRVQHTDVPAGVVAAVASAIGSPRASRTMMASDDAEKLGDLAPASGHYCEDMDHDLCAAALRAPEEAVRQCGSNLTGRLAKFTGPLATKCPRSCGACSLLLSDCINVVKATIGNTCIEGEDKVGAICSGDDNPDKEAYCTYLPSSIVHGLPEFICAHCADAVAGAERRVLTAQVLELRQEQAGREDERILSRRTSKIAEGLLWR